MLLVKTIDLIVLVSKSQGNCRTCTCTSGTIILHVLYDLKIRWRLLYFLVESQLLNKRETVFILTSKKFSASGITRTNDITG